MQRTIPSKIIFYNELLYIFQFESYSVLQKSNYEAEFFFNFLFDFYNTDVLKYYIKRLLKSVLKLKFAK